MILLRIKVFYKWLLFDFSSFDPYSCLLQNTTVKYSESVCFHVFLFQQNNSTNNWSQVQNMNF